MEELEQTISGGREELANFLYRKTAAEQETEQIRKEGEAIRQEVSELSVNSHLLKEQTETLSEDKEKLLSENADLEKEQKKLQQEINKMAHSKETMERHLGREQMQSIAGTIRNAGRGGCYALYFMVVNGEWKWYNR